MAILITTAAAVVVALMGLVGVVLKIAYDSLTDERTTIKADVGHLKQQVSGLLLQGRYKDDYINTLRSHIELDKGPPPPGYPVGLLRIASEWTVEP